MSIYDKLKRHNELEKKYKKKTKQEIIGDVVQNEYQARTEAVQDYEHMLHEYENKLAALEDKIDNLNELLDEEKSEKSYYKNKKLLEYLVDEYPLIVLGTLALIIYLFFCIFNHMKKLFILLLFLGFSFGQNKGIVGVWDCISCAEEDTFLFILKKDNSGYISVGTPPEVTSFEILWETVVTDSSLLYKKTSYMEEGVLIFKEKDSGEIVVTEKYSLIENPIGDLKEMFNNNDEYDNGDILVLKADNRNGAQYFER